jgi:hypothetical protein
MVSPAQSVGEQETNFFSRHFPKLDLEIPKHVQNPKIQLATVANERINQRFFLSTRQLQRV